MYVHTWVSVCVCVCICVFVCAHEGIGQPVVLFLTHYPFYCLRQTLLLGSRALLDYSFWPAISQKAPFSSSPLLRLQVCTTRPDFSQECWGLNSASNLLTEQFPSCFEKCFQRIFFFLGMRSYDLGWCQMCVCLYMDSLCNSLRSGVNFEPLWERTAS